MQTAIFTDKNDIPKAVIAFFDGDVVFVTLVLYCFVVFQKHDLASRAVW